LDGLSSQDADELIRRAYAAAYLWQRAEEETPANEARANWLLSRTWVVLRNGELALHHARRCLTVCESEGLADFDLAYAHESLARFYSCLGDVEHAWLHRSTAAGVSIADPEDRALVAADLAGGPGSAWSNGFPCPNAGHPHRVQQGLRVLGGADLVWCGEVWEPTSSWNCVLPVDPVRDSLLHTRLDADGSAERCEGSPGEGSAPWQSRASSQW
jgi:hypothetical protein